MQEAYEFSKQPLGIGQQLDQSIKLTRATYKSALGVVAMTMVIGVLNAFAFGSSLAEDGTMPEMSGGELTAFIVFILLQVYLYFLMLTRITYAAHGLGDLSDAASFSIKNLHRIIGLYLLFMLAVMVGYVLLIIPGLILTISLSLCFYIFLLEKTGVVASLKRSHELVWGNWMRTMVVFSVGGIIVLIFYFIIGAVAGLAAFGTTTNAEVAINLISAVLSPLVQPYFIALCLVVYHDVHLRKEGDDLSTELDSL